MSRPRIVQTLNDQHDIRNACKDPEPIDIWECMGMVPAQGLRMVSKPQTMLHCFSGSKQTVAEFAHYNCVYIYMCSFNCFQLFLTEGSRSAASVSAPSSWDPTHRKPNEHSWREVGRVQWSSKRKTVGHASFVSVRSNMV